MTGVELAERLILIRPDIPIILCTGFSEVIKEDRAESLGIEAYFSKPCHIREMAEKIRNVLDRK
jgi:CheY-like chemotaxis protein